MTELVITLSECTNLREVDKLVEDNLLRLNPFNRTWFCRFANRAKIRIARVQREAKKSFKIYEKN